MCLCNTGAFPKTQRHKYLCRFDTNLHFLTLSLTLVCVKSTQTRHKNTNLLNVPPVEQICVGQHKDTIFLLKILQTGLSVPAWSGDQRYPYSNHITAFVEKVITFFYIRENSY